MIWLQRSLIFLGLLIVLLADLALTAWPQLAYSLFFSFIIIASIGLIRPLSVALRWAVIQGGMLDLFSSSPFGIYLFSLVTLVCCIQVLQHSWLKQRTLLHTVITSFTALSLATTVFFLLHVLLRYFHLIDRNITTLARFSSVFIGLILTTGLVVSISRYIQRYARSI